MNLLREYIRSLLVEQNTGISQEQEAAIATIYYVRSYGKTMNKLNYSKKRLVIAGLPPDRRQATDELFIDLYDVIDRIWTTLQVAARDIEDSFWVGNPDMPGQVQADQARKVAIGDAQDAYGEDPITALLGFIDMISNENFETGMSVEEAMRVLDIKTEIKTATQELDQLIKTDNDIIALLDDMAMV